jgi:hypothetical protein
MVLKVKTDPDCPGVGLAPDDANLKNWDLNHEATRTNARLRFSMASIRKERWEEIFGRKSRNAKRNANANAKA